MTPAATIRDLYSQLGTELGLKWDGIGEIRPIISHRPEGPKEPPVGPFNMIRPNRIQIIGPPEQQHLKSPAPPPSSSPIISSLKENVPIWPHRLAPPCCTPTCLTIG